MSSPKDSSMIEIEITKLPFQEAYKLLIGTVVPRPIAWVSTISDKGVTNLAPFSFYTAICSNPPSLLFCPVNHPDGREKDTLRNIRVTREFVVNVTTEDLVMPMNQSSGNYPENVSEFDKSGVTPIASTKIKAPRVKESPIQFECVLHQIVDMGDGTGGSGHVVIGRIVHAHFSPTVYQNGKILVDKLKPIARLAGTSYCPVRETFEVERPKL